MKTNLKKNLTKLLTGLDVLLKGSQLPADFETDPWVAAFICELYVLYGSPVSGIECKTKGEKLQYFWATMGIANALASHEGSWRPMRKKVEPGLAAESFARRYYDATKKMVVEPSPVFSDRGENAPLALNGPRDK